MNPKKKNIDKFLETYIPSPSIDDMEADGARVLHRLKSERRNAPSGNSSSTDSPMKAPRAWWQPVAAAVLIGMVGIGLYAIFPVQPVSPPEALLPSQVAAIPPAQIAATQGTDAGPARQFAVASVRQVPISPLINEGLKCLGVDGLLGRRPGVQDPTARRGRCIGPVVFLRGLVYSAYASSSSSFLPPEHPMAVVGIPPGLADSFFQIEAVADDPERVTKGELKLMLQTLLEDRFKARVHLETRELDGHVLTIAKSGIKFKETSGDATGRVSGNSTYLDGKYRIGGVATFLSWMQNIVPIADKTGLTGTYDIEFYLEEIRSAAAAGPAGPRGAGGGALQPRQFTTPIPKALEDQLGLHLERAKVPVEFIVVDHLELPTEN